jgi:hypothetical protein
MNADPRLPTKAAAVARTGLSRKAMMGSITISSVMNPGPPMNGVSAKKAETM